MQCVAGLLSCYTGNCLGEAKLEEERATVDRNLCPQHFKLKSIVVHVPACASTLRLDSTNCKIACLPTGLVKKIVFLYLRGRYETFMEEQQGDSQESEDSSDEESNPADQPHSLSSTTSIKDLVDQAKELTQKFPHVEEASADIDLKVLQDSYLLTFRKGTAAKEKEHVEVKLFMVNVSPNHNPPAHEMKIVHVLLRDHLWVDIVVSDTSSCAVPLNTAEVLEAQTAFQIYRCDHCGDFNECSCEDRSPETIWRREEDTRLDECVVKKKRNGVYSWQDHLPEYPSLHKCSAVCDIPLGVLHLFLVDASMNVTSEFELTITSSKKVQDLAEQVYTMFCISVCHGELKWHITRRYRDFVQMHSLLTKELSTVAHELPKLPPKTWLPIHTDTAFVQTRQLLLETYLRQMSMRLDAMQSVSFLSFLGAVSSPRLEHEWISGVPRDTIHLRVLHKYVEMGDILLFQSNNQMSGVQRTMTGAEWDHVAIVVEVTRGGRQKLMLLEATGDGVTAMPLVSRILAYNSCFINYIALRKLRMQPSERSAFRQRLSAFLEKVEGKPYSMTINKLIQPSETNADLSGFFCSELVAAAFKATGLIDESFAASFFWPGSFGSGSEVDQELARHDAYLEREVVIDCRVLEIALANKDQSGGVGTVVHHHT
ncbi:hypothetical protein Ae201684P_000598 [Aphanomyces euteiches]|uniref:PX domain-containing protein n=1 Tax=Aphanomyces euteiches TaxID=100861 RepID=A0A6G0XA87_9STRA|nr:hypothetical protein Ae201684_006756 [Aphanomyces euteiches]KAH9087186.1 hypothetical protein Ae201684P_000598 [Aphanomyces euteiches]KAH9136698.1 hypothetical protein AeRB84_018290 [Aphanomyces euteiches]